MNILVRVAGAIVLLTVAFVFGILFERGRLLEYKGKIEGSVTTQTQAAKTANQKNQEEANVSQQELRQAMESLDAYYRQHPVVRVQYRDTCAVSETAGNPQGTHAAPAPANAGTYISPYSPEDTQRIAVRLNALQKLLIADGVTVK